MAGVTFVVLTEDQPGVFALAGTYDLASESAALNRAALDHPNSNVFYAGDFSLFSREQVAARRTVIDWQPPLTEAPPP